MIPSFRKGVRNVVAALTGKGEVTAVRPGDNGAPRFAYKGGEWYFGIYWMGGAGDFGGGQGDYTGNLSVGVDVTRCVHRVPTAKQGDWTDGPGDLADLVGRIAERLMNPDYMIANACNAELAVSPNPNGLFYDHFDTFGIGTFRTEGCEWIGATADDTKCPSVIVCTLTFSGLKFTRLVSELAS